MKIKFQLLLLFCIITISAYAQKRQPDSLNIGDPAPPIRVRTWINGTPILSLEKGKIYVIDFWATWCRPCVASMPHLSDLAHENRDKVTFIAIAVWEKGWDGAPAASTKQIKAFVDSMGRRMDFHVAVDDSNFMADHWVEASYEKGIPLDFVVNAQGRIAWIGNPIIGNPIEIDGVLSKIVGNTWDIEKALSKQIFKEHLQELDQGENSYLSRNANWQNMEDYERADSILSAFKKIVKKEPELEYTPDVSYIIFWALLRVNSHKAYEYGKKVIITPTYQEPAYYSIIDNIKYASLKIKISPEIYRLGAEAYQAEIDNANPNLRKLLDIPEIFHKMAAWYLLAHDTLKAREATQKAIEWGNPIKSP